MQKRKKQLLGLAGLMLVAVMTVIASALPAPQASAINSTGVGLKVQVGAVETYAKIVAVNDEALPDAMEQDVVRRDVTVKIEYANVDKIGIVMTDEGLVPKDEGISAQAAGEALTPVENLCGDDDIIKESQTANYCTVKYRLGAELDTKYTVAVTGALGSLGTAPDLHAIIYRAAMMQFVDYDNQGNPIVKVSSGTDKIKSMQIVTYDKDGKQVLETITLNPVYSDGVYTTNVTLNLKGVNAPSGEYDVVLVSYGDDKDGDGSDDIVSLYTLRSVKYTIGGGPVGPTDPDDPNKPTDPDNPDNPDTPDVPSTGKNFLSNLNISRADYLMTGLVAFGMVTIFAVFLIVRRNRR